MSHSDFDKAPLEQPFAGYARLLVKKCFGRVAFWKVRFAEQNLQLILQSSNLPNFEQLLKTSPGSCVHVAGVKCLSKSGEPSIDVNEASVVATCDHMLPDKFHGFTQVNRYENREVDLLINVDVFEYFRLISDVIRGTREYLWSQGFREFNTGVLQEFFEAGLAKPFTTRCNANGKTYNLSLTSEVKLKRLIVSGYQKVFEILQSFRNEGISPIHSPEFTLLEICQAGVDYQVMMNLAEGMISHAVGSTFPDLQVPLLDGAQRTVVNFGVPFDRITYQEACKRFLGLTEGQCALGYLSDRYPDSFAAGMHKFTWVFKLVEKFVAPLCERPTFITDIPSDISPFVKARIDRPSVSERAVLAIRGMDIADVYTDENDPVKVEEAMRVQCEQTGQSFNESCLDLLKYGLPRTASIGLGVNRLLLLLRGDLPCNIRETILYPIK